MDNNDIEMTSQDVFEIMGLLMADNTDLSNEEIHEAIDNAFKKHIANKIAFRAQFLRPN